MRPADVASLRKRLLLAASALTAVAVHGGSRAQAASADVETTCILPDLNGQCPSDEIALERIYDKDPDRCASSLETPGATVVDGQCCYEVRYDCSTMIVGCSMTGRPLLIDDRPLSAATRRIEGFRDAALPLPDITGLTHEERRIAALHWSRIGAAEYTSIAGFQRFALDLLANSAPPDLLAGAARGAADELRHARLAFTFASAFAGAPIGPGEVALPAAVPLHRTLSDLACATAREGCTVETLSACLLAEAREHATDPAIHKALGRMLRDEERHSALAWRTLRWALSMDPTIARAVREALDDAIRGLATEGSSQRRGSVPQRLPQDMDLSRFGVLHPEDARACVQTAIVQLIEPCRDAIFGRAVSSA